MKITHLNEDPGGEYDYGRYNLLWLVTNYETGDYCGSGEAVGYDGAKLWYWGLGHCSCYGPFDSAPDEVALADVTGDEVPLGSSVAGWPAPLMAHVRDSLATSPQFGKIVPRSEVAANLLARVFMEPGVRPVLADALEDDGEEDAALLTWLRS